MILIKNKNVSKFTNFFDRLFNHYYEETKTFDDLLY